MTENRWYDERFIKCYNCKREIMVFPQLGKKFFKCKYCGAKNKNKQYYEFSLKKRRKFKYEE